MVCPLPILTTDFCRVHVFHILNDNADDMDVEAYAKYLFLTIDVRAGCAKDLSLGEHYILDYGNAKVGHIIKTNPVLLKKGYQVITVSQGMLLIREIIMSLFDLPSVVRAPGSTSTDT